MKIEENAVFLTVPCADFCESPDRYSGFDLKITPPFDDRLAEIADKLFGKAAFVFDDGGRKISVGQAAEATRWIYIKQPVFLEKKSFSYNDVIEILSALRGENGCPWDKAQTHESIRSNLIEEAYELVDAIDQGDKDKIIEETGDVLLQAVFHMTIAKEEGEFDFSDVYDALCKKLITRHTHIFGEDKARSSEEALKNWEKNKLREKSITSVAQNLKEVPKGMPSLLRAYKVVKRAAKGGLISSERNSAFEEALKKLRETADVCFEGKDAENLAGETLFNLVNLLRLADIEPEAALNKFTEKFVEKAVQAEVRTRTEND